MSEEDLAQPEQEPTKLWCETCEGTGEVYQEHQAGCHVGGHFKCPDCDGEGYVLSRLYSTTPPPMAEPHKRKPLTDQEIMNIAQVSCIGISPHEDNLNFAKIIEAVHGIKE